MTWLLQLGLISLFTVSEACLSLLLHRCVVVCDSCQSVSGTGLVGCLLELHRKQTAWVESVNGRAT
jgi:hypothetical protein